MGDEVTQREIAELKGRLERLEAAGPSASIESRKKSGVGRILLRISGAAVGIFLLMIIFAASRSSSPCADSEGAKEYARQFSALMLRNPQSAKFDLEADQMGGCRWRVRGTVSSLNSFGAFRLKEIDMTLKGDVAKRKFRVERSNLFAEGLV